MINVATLTRTLRDGRVAVVLFIAVAVFAGSIWFYASSPRIGIVSATVIENNGSINAVKISVSDLSETRYVLPGESTATVLFAVPSPSLDKLAIISKAKDTPRKLSITNADGSDPVVIYEGHVDAPSWSPDGGSIAFSAREVLEGEAGSPEDWKVFRAVRNGDSFSIGNGYKPHPSPLQRTFALTEEGIALLSNNDTAPAVVIASPVFVPETTPFAVSQSGKRVAWVAPADHSLQVFEDVNGYFVPIILSTDIQPQSMVFSPDGKHILGTTHSEIATTLHLIRVSNGRVRSVGELPGRSHLHAWRYEK